jgi:hypothetical protein
MNEALLRNLLRDWIAEEYLVTDIAEFGDEFDSLGLPIPHSEIERRRNLNRLEGLQRVASDRTDLHASHQTILQALDTVPPHEKLCFWTVCTSSHEYFGVASTCSVISFHGCHLSPNDRNA